jgi:hypothetical protein
MKLLPMLAGGLLLVAAGCGAAERNLECSWSRDGHLVALDLGRATDRRHLVADALLAEDLAIRYADHAKGPRSGQRWQQGSYHAARDRCMTALFGIVGRNHGVPEHQVREAASQRSLLFDTMVLLVFATIYGLVASVLAKRAVQRFATSPVTVAAAILVGSVALGLVGFFVGDVWSGLAETVRVGNSHISYRLNRVPWRRYPEIMFGACVVLSWFVGAFRYRSERSREPRIEERAPGLVV